MLFHIHQPSSARYFFNYSNGHHRHLHSSPTRRSSDLRPRAARTDSPGRPCRAGPRRPPRGPRDRKSTRLNSSHVAISYAVFCLQKKTNIDNHVSKILFPWKINGGGGAEVLGLRMISES